MIKPEKRKDFGIMNKQAIFILLLVALFFASAYFTTKIGMAKEENVITEDVAYSKNEEVTIPKNETISTDSTEVKTTPNTRLVIKKYYADCGHTMADSAEIPGEMVNLTKEEFAEHYSGWDIEQFSKDEVVISKNMESFCGEHYLLIAEDGKVVLYSLDEAENRTLMETTEIVYEYLPETDKIILANGIFIYGNEELHKIREDFES